MLWCMKHRGPLGKCLVHFCTWLHPRKLQGVRAGPECRSSWGSIATKEIWGPTMFSRARNGQRCQKNDMQNGKYLEARWQKHASCRGSTQCIRHRVKRGQVFLERSSTPLRIYCCCDLWPVDSHTTGLQISLPSLFKSIMVSAVSGCTCVFSVCEQRARSPSAYWMKELACDFLL